MRNHLAKQDGFIIKAWDICGLLLKVEKQCSEIEPAHLKLSKLYSQQVLRTAMANARQLNANDQI